jgi:hypothetical protein
MVLLYGVESAMVPVVKELATKQEIIAELCRKKGINGH